MGFEKRKRKTVKALLINKGEKVEYQSIIEGTVGDLISSLSIYDDSNNDSAYLVADMDYEIIIRPKK